MMRRLNLLFFGVGLIIIIGAIAATTIALPFFVSDNVNAQSGDYYTGLITGETDASGVSATTRISAIPLGSSGDAIYNLPYSLTTNAQEFSQVRISTLWNIEGENVNWDTLSLHFTIRTYFASDNLTISITEWDENARNDGKSVTYNIDAMLKDYISRIDTLIFLLTIDINIVDDYGVDISDFIGHATMIDIIVTEPGGSTSTTTTTTTTTTIITNDKMVVQVTQITTTQEIDEQTRQLDYDKNDPYVSFSQVGGSINPIDNPVILFMIGGLVLVVLGLYMFRR